MNITFPKENITDVSLFVKWDVLNRSADRFIVVVWINRTTPIQSVTVDGTSYIVTGLTPNTTYIVNIAAVNNCTGPLSTNATVMTGVSFSMDTNTTATVNINPTASITVTSTDNSTVSSVIVSTIKTTTSEFSSRLSSK